MGDAELEAKGQKPLAVRGHVNRSCPLLVTGVKNDVGFFGKGVVEFG